MAEWTFTDVYYNAPNNNKSVFVETMAWRRTGDMPFFESLVAKYADAYMRHSVSISSMY